MKKEVRFGLVGHGMMGKAHSMALSNINKFMPEINIRPILKTICGVGEGLEDIRERFGWEKAVEDWHEVVNDPEIDVVCIAVPGFLHKEIAVASANNGKHVFCEKPMARSYREGMEMCRAIADNHVYGMVNFNYRCAPAVRLAKKLLDRGEIGDIVSYKGFYQCDWGMFGMPMCWKYKKEMDGAGPQQNGIHILDMAQYLIGDIEEVVSLLRNVIPERPREDGTMDTVTNDDDAVWLAKFKNGVSGVFEASRAQTGRQNFLWFEANGTKGTIRFEMERMNELKIYSTKDGAEMNGFKTIMVTEKVHPYIKYWWPTGHVLGWEHTVDMQFYEFLKALDEGYQPSPSFEEALKSQRVLDAVVKSDEEKRWVRVDEITD